MMLTPTVGMRTAWLPGLIITLFLSVLANIIFLGMQRSTEGTALISASQENYRSIFNGVNEAIFVQELFSGKIIDINQKMCEMYGYTREEIISATISTFTSGIPPYTPEEADRLINKDPPGKPQIFEWLAKGNTGRLFWVEVNLKRAVIGGKEHILAVVQDITERKQAEEALKKSEDSYRSVFETTGAGTFIVEEDNTVSLVNREFERLSGYTKAELEGKKSWTEFAARENLEMMKEYHRLRIIDPDSAPRNYEIRIVDRQGNFKDMLLTVDIISGTKKSVVSAVDITERKKEESLRVSEQRFSKIFNASPSLCVSLHTQRGASLT